MTHTTTDTLTGVTYILNGSPVTVRASRTSDRDGVTLTELDGTWYVVTVDDTVGYPSYRDALTGWKLTLSVLGA